MGREEAEQRPCGAASVERGGQGWRKPKTRASNEGFNNAHGPMMGGKYLGEKKKKEENDEEEKEGSGGFLNLNQG